MSLTADQIKQVAQLARLELKPEQVEPYARQLSNIFDLVGQMSTVNTEGVSVMAHPLEMTQRLRQDVVTETNQREAFQEHAPAVQDGLFLVPKVIE